MENSLEEDTKPKKSRWCLIALLITVGIILVLAFLIYWRFWGITKKQKYERCAETCTDLMLIESDIPMCKMKCIELYHYDPTKDLKTQTTNSQTTTNKTSTAQKYDCNYVWPQQIVEKGSIKLTVACTYDRPWCRPGEGTYEDISCCAKLDELTEEKIDCLKLPELLK